MKILKIAMILSALLLSLTACAVNTTPTANADIAGNSGAKIEILTQEYNGESFAEILMISYDGSHPALEGSDGKNPEIDALNEAIKNDIQNTYDQFMAEHSEPSWIEIKSYPFTSGDYLQIVTSIAVYPSYGTSGKLYSYNFSKSENLYVTLETVMSNINITDSELTQRAKDLYVPDAPGMFVADAKAAGFLISGNDIQLLLEVTVDFPESDAPMNGFFSYTPGKEELVELDGECLFDLSATDQMNPPLYLWADAGK